ncbi:hypothetical protein [Aneurinibacillus tyrosinisolvens]|uniref:hypothetical protein n=1 Tax=Aneurinibacillus tyrosinisolvens TaxID=1443435 RepID=UPI00063F89AF|nr:hypothetical protein [Aneurinibacillus tyrosinisolvens]
MNVFKSFDKKAGDLEKKFVRSIKENSFFLTGNGAKNFILGVTKDRILVRSKRGKKPYEITRKRLRLAISQLLWKRTMTRKELEAHSKFSSALMGLVRLICKNLAKLRKTAKGLLRITLKGKRCYHAGADRIVNDVHRAAEAGVECFLVNFFFLRDDKSANWTRHLKGKLLLLDSGAFQHWRAVEEGQEIKPVTVEEYCAFIKRFEKYFIAYFNLDVVGDFEASARNEAYLRAEGLNPIPIYHVGEEYKALERMISEDHPFIGIGGAAMLSQEERKVKFDDLFNLYGEHNYHFLGGGGDALLQYDWFSVDNSFPLKAGRFGKILTPKGQQIKAPKEWTEEDMFFYNMHRSRELEEYDEQFKLDILVPPAVPKKQLALF